MAFYQIHLECNTNGIVNVHILSITIYCKTSFVKQLRLAATSSVYRCY